jgi:hypothetical protein
MITSISQLYLPISQQLPGINSATLGNEFERAARQACTDSAIWAKDFSITTEADVLEYRVTLPPNSDLVRVRCILDNNGNFIDVNDYTITIDSTTSDAGYTVAIESGSPPANIEGTYDDSGETLNGEIVYKNASSYTMYKSISLGDPDTDEFIITSEADYQTYIATDPLGTPSEILVSGDGPDRTLFLDHIHNGRGWYNEGVDDFYRVYYTGTIWNYDNSTNGDTAYPAPGTPLLPPTGEWTGDVTVTITYDKDTPTDFYTIDPPDSSFSGTLSANGAFHGSVLSVAVVERTDVIITFDEAVIGDDPTDEDGDAWVFVPTFNLAPTVGTTSLPDAELTTYADLITNLAFLTLLRYPKSFPWADEVRAREVEQTVRRLRSIAKEDPYRKFKRATIRMNHPSFI